MVRYCAAPRPGIRRRGSNAPPSSGEVDQQARQRATPSDRGLVPVVGGQRRPAAPLRGLAVSGASRPVEVFMTVGHPGHQQRPATGPPRVSATLPRSSRSSRHVPAMSGGFARRCRPGWWLARFIKLLLIREVGARHQQGVELPLTDLVWPGWQKPDAAQVVRRRTGLPSSIR